MNSNAVRAANGLVYYFKLCMKQSGARWDSDNEVEIRDIIVDIFDGVDDVIEDKLDKHISSAYHAE